ncbi:terminal acidic SANT 1 [Zea mays]|uniref:Terminal acidic SANT 1 n=2 Tax=Zea mays TaxID=4577 RepID=A0A1D6LMN5_MAIZE|nr:terminal acidic SANT 1 [Zea mays]AQK80835.1 terminal acidic SANT 1 [Zea mays]
MPRLTPAHATLILDHVLGDPSIPTAVTIALIAGIPSPSDPTPRLRRGVLLRRLATDPVSESSLETLHLLASLPACASPIAAAHIAVAAFLAASAPDFDAVARALFARPDGRARQAVHGGSSPALASDDAIATVDQFEAAVGMSSSQTILRVLWGNRAAVEERVQELLAAEWAAIGPSRLEALAMRIVGDGAVDTWGAADEAMRANLRILAGEAKTREILDKLEKTTCNTNPISTPAVEKVMDALKASCADLHSIVEDPLPAAKAVADELLTARMEKLVSLNAQEVGGQPTTCGVAGPSIHNDKDNGPGIGKPHSLMERNATARTSQWEESLGLDGSEPPSPPRPHLPSPRRLPPSPLSPPGNKNNNRRKARRWSLFEEETLRKGVEEYVTLYGVGNWRDILDNNAEAFTGRTPVDLKDKWRNMLFR